MSRLPTPGQDDGSWGGILNDYLAVEHNGDGTLKKAGSITQAASDAAAAVSAANGKYTKPGGGIPAADLSSTVNTYLADAQTAVQSVNGKSGQAVSLTAADVSAVSTTAQGAANGVATLTSGSKLSASQLPANVPTKSSNAGDTGKAIDAYSGSPLSLNSLTVTPLTSGPYTVLDGNEVIQMNSSSPQTINVPTGLSQSIIEIANLGTGSLTIASTGATFTPAGPFALGQYDAALLRKTTTDTWLVSLPFDEAGLDNSITSLTNSVTSINSSITGLQTDWRLTNPRREAYGMWPNDEIPTSSITLNANNQLYYRRFVPKDSFTATGVAWTLGVLSTNDDACDFAILSSTGVRLASTGSQSGRLNATLGHKSDSFTASVALTAGTEYFLCMSNAYGGGTAAQVAGYNTFGSAVSLLSTAIVGTVDKYSPNGLRANGAVTIGSSPGIPSGGAQTAPGLFIRGARS